MRNEGQIYPVKNCPICSHKLEPCQPGDTPCFICHVITEYLDDFLKTEYGMFFTLDAIQRRINNVDVQEPTPAMGSEPGEILPDAIEKLDSAWIRAV